MIGDELINVSKLVGWERPDNLSWPTHAEIKRSNPVERLRWWRFLPVAASETQRRKIEKIRSMGW